MKSIQFISLAIIIFLSLAVIGCNDNEDKIYVSAPNIHVRENLEQKIEISGGTGIYSCEVDDNEIASTKISGHTLIITGNTEGTTSATIKDGTNTPITIVIKVLLQKVLFELTELETKIEIEKTEYYNLIKEELQKDFLFPVGATYELIIKSESTNTQNPVLIKGDLFIYHNTENKSFNGTFELYGDQLIMSYSGQVYKYVIDADKEYWNISEDLTELYKKKYPEANIRYVYNDQVLKLLKGTL